MALNQFGMAMIDIIIRFETGIFAMQFGVKKPIISINFMILKIVVYNQYTFYCLVKTENTRLLF